MNPFLYYICIIEVGLVYGLFIVIIVQSVDIICDKFL